jgi:hypothetical protein
VQSTSTGAKKKIILWDEGYYRNRAAQGLCGPRARAGAAGRDGKDDVARLRTEGKGEAPGLRASGGHSLGAPV